MKKGIKKIILGGLISLSLSLNVFNVQAQTKEEFLNEFLDEVYTTMLNRESDEDGKAYWNNQILNNGIGILDFLNQILNQNEFGNLKISSEEFIKKVYKLLMNREPDEEGFDYWLKRLEDNPNNDQKLALINSMAGSEEFLSKINELGLLLKNNDDKQTETSDVDVLIKDAYKYLLGRDYDVDGLNFWKGQLTSKDRGAIDLINEFISLDEFKSRKLTDKEFISLLYEVLFDREVDADGLNYWNSIYQKDKSSNRMKNIVLNIADDKEFLSRIKAMNVILKKVDTSLFYSELLTSNNKVRGITSAQLSEIKKDMTFFDIIVKLGRTRNMSSVKGVSIAKYIVDGSKEIYFIFSDPKATYGFNPMEILKAQK